MKGKFIISMTVAAMLTMNSMAYASSDILKNLWDETQIGYAEQQIDKYLKDGWDLLGWKGEKLYFQLRDDYAKGNIIKQIEFEAKTAGKNFRMLEKNYKENDLIYDTLFITSVGGKALAKYFKVGKFTHAKNKVKVAKDFQKTKRIILKKMGNLFE
ncbi:hypothetical protein [Anaerosolibacter sp.]|uniref:hypothetical protein n=1 Tax=Anaerosolibacter sp. TaxID=1872527 RepID=UPI0039EF79A6